MSNRFSGIDDLITQIAHDTRDGSYISALANETGQMKAEILKLENRVKSLIKEKDAIQFQAQVEKDAAQRTNLEYQKMKKNYVALMAAYNELLDTVNMAIQENLNKHMEAKMKALMNAPYGKKQ